MNVFETRMEEKFKEYGDWLDGYAEQVFEDMIKPWLEKYHLIFIAGMGDYVMYATSQTPGWFYYKYKDTYSYNPDLRLDKDKLPNHIRAVLESSVPAFDANNFGSLMPSHNKETAHE